MCYYIHFSFFKKIFFLVFKKKNSAELQGPGELVPEVLVGPWMRTCLWTGKPESADRASPRRPAAAEVERRHHGRGGVCGGRGGGRLLLL